MNREWMLVCHRQDNPRYVEEDDRHLKMNPISILALRFLTKEETNSIKMRQICNQVALHVRTRYVGYENMKPAEIRKQLTFDLYKITPGSRWPYFYQSDVDLQ